MGVELAIGLAAASLVGSGVQGAVQQREAKKARKAQEQAQREATLLAQRERSEADMAFAKANSKQPDVDAILAAEAGTGLTNLTKGKAGREGLLLGRSSLLGF